MPEFAKSTNRSLRTGKRYRWIFLIAVITFSCWLVYTLNADRIMHPIAQGQIKELIGADVTIGSVDFKSNGSIRINELTIRSPEKTAYGDTIIRAKAVDVSFSLISILKLLV